MSLSSSFRRFPHKVQASYVRNTVFGVENSLVSTVGLLSGVAVTNIDRSALLITGLVLIFVEGFSMGVGTYLSETSAYDYLKKKHPTKRSRRTSFRRIIGYSLTGFLSYVIAGSVPLAPYFFIQGYQALVTSIILALIALFIFGMLESDFARAKIWHGALRMFIIGGAAIGLGVLIGLIADII